MTIYKGNKTLLQLKQFGKRTGVAKERMKP